LTKPEIFANLKLSPGADFHVVNLGYDGRVSREHRSAQKWQHLRFVIWC